jgi:hypothetical protein
LVSDWLAVYLCCFSKKKKNTTHSNALASSCEARKSLHKIYQQDCAAKVGVFFFWGGGWVCLKRRAQDEPLLREISPIFPLHLGRYSGATREEVGPKRSIRDQLKNLCKETLPENGTCGRATQPHMSTTALMDSTVKYFGIWHWIQDDCVRTPIHWTCHCRDSWLEVSRKSRS